MKKILVLASFLAVISIHAQDINEGNEMITDRPDQTESPNAVGVGVLQIESGLLFERSKFSDEFSASRTVYPTSLFRIGIAKKLELRIVNEVVEYKTFESVSGKLERTVRGTENMQVGFKYQISESGKQTQIGVMAHAILPTGSRGISNERYGIFSRINISHDISDNKNISGNFGYNNFDLDILDDGFKAYQDGNFTYTLVYGVGLGDRVGMYLEAFGDWVNFDNWETNMDAGMTYLIGDNVQLDYSYGWGVNRIMNYHSIGISVRLPK